MSIHTEGKPCSELGRVLVINDTPVRSDALDITATRFADYILVEEVIEFGHRGKDGASHCERLQAGLVAQGFQTRVQVVQLGWGHNMATMNL
jgi:hypothetical protein